MTDCGVRGLWFKSPSSILTSRTETSSISQVVRDGWDPYSLPLGREKKSHAVESSTWPLNSHNCLENYPKTPKKKKVYNRKSFFLLKNCFRFYLGSFLTCINQCRTLRCKPCSTHGASHRASPTVPHTVIIYLLVIMFICTT